MDYTPAQRQAIETIDRNLQIIACAGSGKTQVISARIVRILQRGVPPSAVVAFTFTEKAAGELKDRIDRLARETLGDMFVGAIHGYYLNLLKSPHSTATSSTLCSTRPSPPLRCSGPSSSKSATWPTASTTSRPTIC